MKHIPSVEHAYNIEHQTWNDKCVTLATTIIPIQFEFEFFKMVTLWLGVRMHKKWIMEHKMSHLIFVLELTTSVF